MSEGGPGSGVPSGHESPIDAAIREAIERGEFDNLPGAGRPLPNRGSDENWWLTQYLEREEGSASGFLPRSLLLRREAEDLPERVARMASEGAVRDHVLDLNRRIAEEIRTPTGGPPLAMRPLDADAVVDRWRENRATSANTAEPTSADRRPRQSLWRRIFTNPSH